MRPPCRLRSDIAIWRLELLRIIVVVLLTWKTRRRTPLKSRRVITVVLRVRNIRKFGRRARLLIVVMIRFVLFVRRILSRMRTRLSWIRREMVVRRMLRVFRLRIIVMWLILIIMRGILLLRRVGRRVYLLIWRLVGPVVFVYSHT